MFSHIRLPEKPPSTLTEAVSGAIDLLNSTGLEAFSVQEVTPAASTSSLVGGSMEIVIPIGSLESLLHTYAVQAAAEHGVTVVATNLKAQQAGQNRVHLQLTGEAKFFGSKIKMGLSGFAGIQDETHLVFSQFETENGGGMFGGMASAFIKPKLAALESGPLDLQKIAGIPVKVPSLKCEQGALYLTLAFV